MASSGSYTVTMPTYSSSTVGSVLLITVTSSGAGRVEHTLNGVIGAVRTSLAKLQAGVRPDNRIQLTVLAPAVSPSVDTTHTVRSVAIVAGFGLLVALGVPWMLDAQVKRHMPLAAGAATRPTRTTGDTRRMTPGMTSRPSPA